MIRHPLRHFLLLCCLLFGLAGATSAIAGLPREQSLVAGSMPKVARGAKASISFIAIVPDEVKDTSLGGRRIGCA